METNELIDVINILEGQKADLQARIDDLRHDLIARLISEGKKQEYGSDGLGYAVQSGRTDYKFGKPAYSYLESKGLIQHFIAAPKITKTKLDDLLKTGDLTFSDMAEIEKHMTQEQGPYTLRKVVAKEAVIS